MTLTFTSDEWEKHVAAIDAWRYGRERVMFNVLEKFRDKTLAAQLFDVYNRDLKEQSLHELPSPIGGTKLRIS